MLKFFSIVFTLLLALQGIAFAQTDMNAVLSQPKFTALSEKNAKEAKASDVWSEDMKLGSFYFQSSCYFVDASHPELNIIDISGATNLGYFGTDPAYDRLENKPLIVSENEWKVRAKHGNFDITPDMINQPNVNAVLIRTRIWYEGQRYTKHETALIIDGVYYMR